MSDFFRAGGAFSTVRFDFDARGQLVTSSRPGPGPRVTRSNEYEKRWMYSYFADGQWAQLA